MLKQSKYKYCYILQGNWGSHGWEDIGYAEKCDTARVKKLRALFAEHQASSRAQFRIVERRMLRED